MSQLLAVPLLVFSLPAFPSERLPGWPAAMNEVLPIQAMAFRCEAQSPALP
jgi:hypothetical protein